MAKFIPSYWKQILVLLIITPILTELLTNNIPARQLFKPGTFLLFATIVYGPVLLLRELAVRWRLGLVGYIILGLVYGLYNEGLLAKTIFQTQLPNPSFNNYGVLWGINFSWANNIVVFHAFYALLFPILLVNYLFPLASRKAWLNRWFWLSISAALLAYVSWKFLKNMQQPVTTRHYIFLIIVMIALFVFAKNFRDEKMFEHKRMQLWSLYLYGVIFVIALFTLSDIIVRSRISSIVFISYILAVLCITTLLLNLKSAVKPLLIFCLSAELTFAACCLLVAKISHSRTGMESAVAFIIIFTSGLVIVSKRKLRSNLSQSNFQDATG